ncbi:MAG: hypothetical protein H0U71_07490 [Gammaproteobacteria bacterium]|nr:hypothetical protein [Gammaproteobacteria bacterium]
MKNSEKVVVFFICEKLLILSTKLQAYNSNYFAHAVLRLNQGQTKRYASLKEAQTYQTAQGIDIGIYEIHQASTNASIQPSQIKNLYLHKDLVDDGVIHNPLSDEDNDSVSENTTAFKP